MSEKRTIELSMDQAGLSAWLKELAEGFEKGVLLSGEGAIDLEGFKSFKLSFKRSEDGLQSVKVAIKYPKPQYFGASPPAGAEAGQETSATAFPKYKSLKKHMKQTFKSIGTALSAGQMPPALEARSFIADSLLMVEYQGKGDEFYDAYREQTRAFEAALAAADLDALQAAYEALARTKRDCHSRHA